jgi:hypothetical protein
MPVDRVDADKPNHKATLMEIHFTADGQFSAICPHCDGYVIVTDEQAGNGRAQCFGNVILLSWN